VAETKRLGFNTIRKHMKVEPDRWYYDADELGIHFCLGAPLARLEVRVALRLLLERYRDVEVAADEVQHRSPWTMVAVTGLPLQVRVA
jgi:cytochrome P450